MATESDNMLYQLADGTVVSLAQQLLESMAKLVDHPEGLRAMASYRSLEQAALEDWGVHLEHIDSSAPFWLIKCPLCSGTEFASVDFAQLIDHLQRVAVKPFAAGASVVHQSLP